MTSLGNPLFSGTFKGLHFEVYGEGRPIIALHGLGATLFSWRYLVKPLSSEYRLYLFDLRGHGASERPNDQRYSLEDQAELILEFIRNFDLKELTLIGHSMGGGVALLVSIRLVEGGDDRLASLILLDTIAFPEQFPLLFQLFRLPLIGRIVLSVLPAKVCARLALRLAFHDRSKITPEIVDKYAENLSSKAGVNALASVIRQMIPEDIDDLVEQYKEITAPTLILWGEQDRLVLLEKGERLRREIKNSEFRSIPNCGHVPQEERPSVVTHYICNFLQSIDRHSKIEDTQPSDRNGVR